MRKPGAGAGGVEGAERGGAGLGMEEASWIFHDLGFHCDACDADKANQPFHLTLSGTRDQHGQQVYMSWSVETTQNVKKPGSKSNGSK